VQKSGRLTDPSLDLLARCGLKLSRGKDQLMGYGENMPLDVLFVRDDDIPDLVQEDVCDLGLVGLNVLEEKRLELAARGSPARFRGCARSTSVAAACRSRCRSNTPTDGPQSLQGKRIATTYPHLLGVFLRQRDIERRDRHALRRGRNRPAPGPRGPDLRSGLHRLDAAGQSPARGGDRAGEPRGPDPHAGAAAAEKNEWVERLLLRVEGVQQVKESKYIMLHAPRSALPAIRRLLPGSESPTIIPLEGSPDRVVCTRCAARTCSGKRSRA
jgi:ATP phosphoribosyltransferase